jgi:hypothetical protein|tara:strand:- start:2150 stop:2551 length:402 start_codon:yes stop_codon:yes gene_type:complete
LTLKTPIISIATKRPCFYISQSDLWFVCKWCACVIDAQNNKKLVPSKIKGRRGQQARERRKKMQKEEASVRFQISRFLRHFFLLFSLFVPRVCGRFLSLVSLSDEHRISHLIVFLARAALLGFNSREREREKE